MPTPPSSVCDISVAFIFANFSFVGCLVVFFFFGHWSRRLFLRRLLRDLTPFVGKPTSTILVSQITLLSRVRAGQTL